MKKYLIFEIVFILFLFVFLGNARAAYNWQPAEELSESDYALLFSAGVSKISSPIAQFARAGNTIVLKLQNGETVLAGIGKKQQKNRKKQETSTIPYNPEYDLSQSATSTDTEAADESIFKRLTSLGTDLAKSLEEMRKNDKYDFTNTDKLFAEITALIEQADWKSDNDGSGSLPDFRWALGYGKRYGIPGVEVLSRTLGRFPASRYLKSSFEDAMTAAIRSAYASEAEQPSAQERAQLAQKLLVFYESYTDLIPEISAVTPALGLVAPDFLRKIGILERARRAAQKKKEEEEKEEEV